MQVFKLNYGDLIRPPYRILGSRGWGQGTNLTEEFLVVYGPKHQNDPSICDTTPYVLAPRAVTPDDWDCDGFFLPADRILRIHRKSLHGPRAIKFWNFRRFSVSADGTGYRCSRPNGTFEPSKINWAIPNFTYAEVLQRIQLRTTGR
jgi:hypothetical protein